MTKSEKHDEPKRFLATGANVGDPDHPEVGAPTGATISVQTPEVPADDAKTSHAHRETKVEKEAEK